MSKSRKSRAYGSSYESPRQLALPGFESTFERELNPGNRWIRLSKLIPRDELCSIYEKRTGAYGTGLPGVNARVVIGSLIIKYIFNSDDREIVEPIGENVYMQYFLGYKGFITDKPFDASLFVDFRKIPGLETISAINDKIMPLKTRFEEKNIKKKQSEKPNEPTEDRDKTDSDTFGKASSQATVSMERRAQSG